MAASVGAEIALIALLYLLLCVCIVFPPTELRSAGLTIDTVLSGLLGSEDLQFVQYHIRRTTTTLIAHSLLLIGFYVTVAYALPELDLYNVQEVPIWWKLWFTLSVVTPLTVTLIAYHWSRNSWASHPIARQLELYATSMRDTGSEGDARTLYRQGGWGSVADSINAEFRRIDKFSTSPTSVFRVVVTDSWLMKISPYTLYVLRQSEARVAILGTDTQVAISDGATTGAQFLTILVTSQRNNGYSFSVRLNSLEYGDFREKLAAPIRNVRNVVIQQTLSDRFVQVFREHVAQNPRHRISELEELDSCIGCMQNRADVILRKQCALPTAGDCMECHCRPMWCINCMAKWFANRQDQQQPNTWLSSKCPCPTCRARFCLLDVLLLE